MHITVHFTLRTGLTGSQSFVSEYGAHCFERYLDTLGASYEREGVR